MKVKESAKITTYDYTATVENWYIWWFYFKVDKPSEIKEAWIEYYNNTVKGIPTSTQWKKEIIKNELDWEFAAFIIPKTKYTNVRWYIITNSWLKIYTNNNWNVISTWLSLNDYYNLYGKRVINFWQNN